MDKGVGALPREAPGLIAYPVAPYIPQRLSSNGSCYKNV